MNLSQDRKLQKLLRITVILLALTVLVFNLTSTQNYSREAYLYNTMIANGGCSWDYCPNLVIDKALEETNGLLPPSKYAQGTRMKMRAICTYTPFVCGN